MYICMYLYIEMHIQWNERVPYADDLVQTPGDQSIVFGAVVESGHSLVHSEHPLITSFLQTNTLRLKDIILWIYGN